MAVGVGAGAPSNTALVQNKVSFDFFVITKELLVFM